LLHLIVSRSLRSLANNYICIILRICTLTHIYLYKYDHTLPYPNYTLPRRDLDSIVQLDQI